MSDQFPKGAPKPGDDDTVQILVTEAWAREFESLMLRPQNLHLAGPILFSEDDLPSYIIGIGAR